MNKVFRLGSSTLSNIKQIFSPTPTSTVAGEILRLANGLSTDEERSVWLEDLVSWLARDSEKEGSYVRFRYLFQILDANPDWRVAAFRQIDCLLSNPRALLRLLVQTGYAEQQSLLQEVSRRFGAKWIPSVREHDAFEIAMDVFKSDEDVLWCENIPEPILIRLGELFSGPESANVRSNILVASTEALYILLARLADLALISDVRRRTKHWMPSESPFLRLQIALTARLESRQHSSENQIAELLGECEAAIDAIYQKMEEGGTSVELVHRLESINATLQRVRTLMSLIFHSSSGLESKMVHRLFAASVAGVFESRSIFGYVRQQTHLLSRKIAERNSKSGEHYIARTPADRCRLFHSALKGGAIVLVLTLSKFLLHSMFHLPGLLDALVVWFLYSAAFIWMQFTDSTLATKLPSFTASRLARLTEEVKQVSDVHLLTDELKVVVSSQAIAFIGNLVSLIPLAAALSYASLAWFDSPVVDSQTAMKTLSQLHPIFSFAIPLGALTGVLLWLSSLAGGWFENWIAYRRIPEALSGNRRLRRVFGAAFTARLSKSLEHHASAFSANIALGFLFGFAPFAGLITGLPLDSKHVTISSTGAVLSSFAILERSDFIPIMIWTAVGLVFVGAMNLFVSFALALLVAARATSVNPRRFKVLVRMVRKNLIGF